MHFAMNMSPNDVYICPIVSNGMHSKGDADMGTKQKGFTLIELMIVVAIIGILAAIALPKFADMLEKSRDGATKGNLDSMKSAINMYTADQSGIYPTQMNDIHIPATNDINFIKKYMDSIPTVKSTAKSDLNIASGGQGNGPGVGTATLIAGITQANWNGAGLGSLAAGTLQSALTGKGWRYDSIEGRIWVNSKLIDMNSTFYTTYGYQ
jgi:prepilin-type N-terminal cleavage/methylation domain-containing protein